MLPLIDGDVLAYLACESKWTRKNNSTLIALDKASVVFSKQEETDYLIKSWTSFQQKLEELLETLFATHYLMAVKAPTNFRDVIFPLEFIDGVEKPVGGYKANRWKPKGLSNQYVPEIRKLAVHTGLAIEAHDREADDMLRIWAQQAIEANEPYIIVTNDKDMKCIPGSHFNLKLKKFSTVTAAEAMRFYYQQLLMGDPTDNIPGIIGIGPVKAKNYVATLWDEEELQELVVEQYMNAYGGLWFDHLMSNGKLLYLQKHFNDYFTAYDWPIVQALGIPLEHLSKNQQVACAPVAQPAVAASPSPQSTPSPRPGAAVPAPKPEPITASKPNTSFFKGVVPK